MAKLPPENSIGSAQHCASASAIFLVGFMGAGKTSVGRGVAATLGWSFIDLDDRVIAKQGRTIAEIFREDGEPAFRSMESRALAEVISEVESGLRAVVALGGGAYVQEQNASAIRDTGLPVFFLDATLDELRDRCVSAGGTRPLFQNEQQFRELYESRRGHYLLADARIDTTSKSVKQVTEEIVQILQIAK